MTMRLLSMSETLSEIASGTQHHRQLARLMEEPRVLDDGISLERDPEEEAQRGHRVIEDWFLGAVLGQMQIVAHPQSLPCQAIVR